MTNLTKKIMTNLKMKKTKYLWILSGTIFFSTTYGLYHFNCPKNFLIKYCEFFNFKKSPNVSTELPTELPIETLDNDLEEESLIEYFAKDYFNDINF
jgi:hypothetical protein